MHTFGLHKDVTCQAEIFIFFYPRDAMLARDIFYDPV